MGLDANGTKFLMFARQRGVSFSKTAMIGRQSLLLSPAKLSTNLRSFGFESTAGQAKKLIQDSNEYSEGFLKLLGADEIVSFDASAYENASVVHDFNHPIPDKYKDQFSVVLDGGTLEHIFNFPAAIKNCMDMVAEGGHFLGITPANNQLGHGFYQFSPELYFRVFSEQNGFKLQNLIIFEETADSAWYEVADPDVVHERVTLRNNESSMLLIIAKKIRSVSVFETPQQSDYAAVWRGETDIASIHGLNQAGPSALGKVARLPLAVLRRLRLRLSRHFGMLNRRPKHFKKIDLP